jgi:hypothetical protein
MVRRINSRFGLIISLWRSPWACFPIYQRFAGIDGSAYVIGGFGMTALGSGNIIVVPIRSGVGLRLGANIGYLKFTPRATWNPF